MVSIWRPYDCAFALTLSRRLADSEMKTPTITTIAGVTYFHLEVNMNSSTQWIRTARGQANLQHVVEIVTQKQPGKVTSHMCRLINGESVQCFPDDYKPNNDLVQIQATGFIATEYCLDADADDDDAMYSTSHTVLGFCGESFEYPLQPIVAEPGWEDFKNVIITDRNKSEPNCYLIGGDYLDWQTKVDAEKRMLAQLKFQDQEFQKRLASRKS